MASRFDSLDQAVSPVKPVSSVIHLCMSVKRTVSGSVSGYLSASAIAMSSKLSQLNVGGISHSPTGADCTSVPPWDALSAPLQLLVSVIRFLGVVLVPVR